MQLDTLHLETKLGDKAVNADSAAFVEDDLGDESMLLESEACCVILTVGLYILNFWLWDLIDVYNSYNEKFVL